MLTTTSALRESMPRRTVPCWPLPICSMTMYWLTILRPERSWRPRTAWWVSTTSWWARWDCCGWLGEGEWELEAVEAVEGAADGAMGIMVWTGRSVRV